MFNQDSSGNVQFSLRDGTLNLSLDRATGAMTTIDYGHHEIHAGSHYFIEGCAVMTSGQTMDWAVTTPNTTKWVHMTFSITGSKLMSVYQYENTTVGTGGTIVTAINSDRNSTNTAGLLAKMNPTITNTGTLLLGCFRTGASGTNQFPGAGGSLDRESEINLKQNEDYLWHITSLADDNDVSYLATFYEHTNRS